MDLNQYQNEAQVFAVYKTPLYPFLALAEEAGEVCGKVAKHLRKHGETLFENTQEARITRYAVAKELGDVLWQVQACASEIGCSLEEIAQMNLNKLSERDLRGVIVGEGDDR